MLTFEIHGRNMVLFSIDGNEVESHAMINYGTTRAVFVRWCGAHQFAREEAWEQVEEFFRMEDSHAAQ